ncbi:helix-turn-helix transcriptional regulator [Streptomyces sp. NBC_01239]|uniref:helix-turn-helix domain-containing protein n=1 Tax=Streptomyces sp. NBC_01239 TaxID=2903792 RepID=UPI00224CE23F|nr:helix-turn-helix transcriptional regulator [Streptomyces sp. NBC_01239]MCX4816620.1 helix-turn-helix transcriptional regulator [Streptomyces sp. NBC_01239]
MATATAGSAAVQRLRLRTELREARLAADLTQRQVADQMEWSPSKLLRIEAGEVGITVNDLRLLLTFYGVEDPGRVDGLLELARGSRKMPFTEYRDIYPKDFLDFLAMEASAWINRTFQSMVLPGLLQTEEYAAAIIRAYSPHESAEQVDRMVEARMLRQDVLDNEQAQFFFTLDESVIRRQVGGPKVMRAQLRQLAELAARPRINVMIQPFSLGAHAALAGPFTLFEFKEDVPTFVYLENPRGNATISTAPEDAATYIDLFQDLEAKAIKEHVPEILLRVADGLGSPQADLIVPAA